MTVTTTLTARPLLHYDFRSVSSTIVPDLTGNGHTGVLRGMDRGGAQISPETVFGRTLPALHLTGSRSGGFLQLPDGVLNGNKGLTVSFFCRIRSLTRYGVLFSFGKDFCFYLSALPDPERPGYALLSPGLTGGGRSQEAALERWASLPFGRWFHVAVTLADRTPSECVLYLDGKRTGCFRHRRLDSRALDGTLDCFFGFGTMAQEPCGASFAQIQIHPEALTETEAASLFTVTPKIRLELEAEALQALFAAPLTGDLTLPGTGSLGCSIAWRSLKPQAAAEAIPSQDASAKTDAGLRIAPEGEANSAAIQDQPPSSAEKGRSGGHCRFRILRPAPGSPAAEGCLEALLSYETASLTHRYCFSIPPLPADPDIVRGDADSVRLPFPGHVAGDLSLPEAGPEGSVFSWTSSRPERMDTRGHLNTRPEEESEELTLTLLASYGKASCQRAFPLKLLPKHYRDLPRRPYVAAAPLTAKAPREQASPAPLSRIRLSGGNPLADNQRRCLDYLLLLDSDRMLWNFRRTFGVPCKGAEALGGWEEPSGLLRGHSTGHFLSALAHAWAATGDSRFREKALGLAGELHRLQSLSEGDPADFATACSPSDAVQSKWSRNPSLWGRGFLSAYPPDQFALLEQLTPYATIWAPYYTLHKLLAGLLDCHVLLGSPEALEAACGIGDWVYARLSQVEPEQRARMWKLYIAGEYGGMNESLAKLSSLTGKPDYLAAARMFDNPAVFDGLAQGRDTITGIHANQHIPQIIGAMEEYRATGDPYYYRLARNFWELVVNRYTYSIGGVGRGENFREPDLLAANIEGGRNCETCATYNLLKLTGLLYRYAPDYGPYMDYCERALLNHIAASQNPALTQEAHHGVTYMLPIGPGAEREYSNDYDDFTCCHGTGMENHVRYTEQMYFFGTDGSLYLNLFWPSIFHWEERGLILSLEGKLPGESFRLTVRKEEKGLSSRAGKTAAAAPGSAEASGFTGRTAPAETASTELTATPLTLRIRIPCWCRGEFRVSLNGQELPPPDGSSHYYTIRRCFAEGDCLSVSTPYRLHLSYTPDAKEGFPAASVLYGPLVMTALCADTDWLTLNLPPVLEDAFEIRWEDTPVLWYDDLKFVPAYAAHSQPYHTYFKISLT